MRYLCRLLFRKLINYTAGKYKFHKYYSIIHEATLRGMNYGNWDCKVNGEFDVIKQIAASYSHESSETILFDIGGNIGDYAIELSKAFGDNSKIYSFEPVSKTYTELVSNVKSIPNITPINIGFSDKEGELEIFKYSSDSGLSSVFKRDLSEIGAQLDEIEKIQLTTIDQFCKQNNIKEIYHLKIDVEGNEMNVLKGASNMINSGNIKSIQFEYGEAWIDARTYLKDAYELLQDYSFYRVVKGGVFPLGKYDTRHEIFKTINIIAFHKSFK